MGRDFKNHIANLLISTLTHEETEIQSGQGLFQ